MMINRVVKSITSQYEIVLGSSSPRRYEIMHDSMGFPQVTIMKPSFEEDLDKSHFLDPVEYVRETSYQKAVAIIQDLSKVSEFTAGAKLVICADTVVIDSSGTIYEKPQCKKKQLTNLMKFCYEDKDPLKVVTAVTLVKWINKNDYSIKEPFHEETKVYCDPNTPLELLEDYVESEEGIQVAGGFKIQGSSGAIIKKIEGDYYNVVGLPLNRLFQEIYQWTRVPS